MSVRTAILAAARARYRESTAIFPDQIRESLAERELAEQRLAGHLQMNLSERDMNNVKRALRDLRVHMMTLPAVRERNRRNMVRTQHEIREWYANSENENSLNNFK